MAEQPREHSAPFTVPRADLTDFYDGFLSNGCNHFLSSSPDGHLDQTRFTYLI
ncbi:hypothetical protein KIN20_033516 [Parelaphostrongylus tenuis]|uniref:Uncharacterized protein n=1 Tax=Parelaphostrongylus tenuis TaxID=148309 RepID=A0AAD5RAF7_PARTN|nr:hypothetical protein KIN20_033516 [Parelaphostrongylus tenuis]